MKHGKLEARSFCGNSKENLKRFARVVEGNESLDDGIPENLKLFRCVSYGFVTFS